MRIWGAAAAAALMGLMPAVARAGEPGVGEKVYGATVEPGVTELEARYGRLTGDAADGEDGLVLELAHGFSKHFYGAVLATFERGPGEGRKLAALSLEGLAPVGRIDALKLDVALYGEYEAARHGPDAIETKLILQHVAGPFDGRLNLIAEKTLAGGEAVEFGYAASADWTLAGELRGGFEAYGELGTTRRFLPREAHYAGPVVKAEIEHLPGNSELEITTGYLFALGEARDFSHGQIKLMLEWETRF